MSKIKVIKKGQRNKALWFWLVDITDNNDNCCFYDGNNDCWVFPDDTGNMKPWTSTSYITDKKTIRSIIRKILKKWKIPAGYIITVQGPFRKNDWILKTV